MNVNKRDEKNPICECRTKLGITQQELANVIKVSRSTLSGYENGKDIPISALKKLSEELEVSTDYLLGISHNETTDNEELWKEFALEDECIEKIRMIAHLDYDRNYTLAIDTINYLFKYSNNELIEYIGEYLNTPLPPAVNYKIDTKVTRKQKQAMNEQRKYEADKFLIFRELDKLFDQIKGSEEVKQKYNKYKNHIERLDRPCSKFTDNQKKRYGIK